MLIDAERDAMGDDEYHPISRKGTNLTEAGGIGYTVVDSIDTMLIMGLADEYSRARDWIVNNMTFDRDANFNTFEVSVSRPDVTFNLDLWFRLRFEFSAVFSLHIIYQVETLYFLRRLLSSATASYQHSTPLRVYHFRKLISA
jgi:hypothetical protein